MIALVTYLHPPLYLLHQIYILFVQNFWFFIPRLIINYYSFNLIRLCLQVGACAHHSNVCGSGAGVFLRVRECEILLMSCPTRGCFLPPPYLDEYGETDQGLRRGNPLSLCSERYKKLENMWLGHTIHEEVSRSLESSHTIAVTQWQNL